MKIYISGPVSGTYDAAERFARAEKRIKGMYRFSGWDIVNPNYIISLIAEEDWTWGKFMDVSLVLLRGCDAIYMLRGWENSTGAKCEKLYAEGCGMRVIFEEDVDGSLEYIEGHNGVRKIHTD